MSVWYDMGLRNGRMFGVNPYTYLSTAFGFWVNLRKHIDQVRYYDDMEFIFRVKRDPVPISSSSWIKEETWSSFSFTHFSDSGPVIGRPIPENYWNATPTWSIINGLSEADILQEEIISCPYLMTYTRNKTNINDPAWALQRYRLIQKMRYAIIPVDIWIYNGHDKEWNIYYQQYMNFDSAPSAWGYYNYPFSWDKDGNARIRVKIPEYWTQGNTVCRIGFENETTPSTPVPPIIGCFWYEGNEYFSAEYTNNNSTSSFIKCFGAVDLSTHPDFEDYFDPVEEGAS